MNKKEPMELLNDPNKNVTIFAIVASLAMSINVFWAAIGFFVPQVSASLQSFMMPSLIYFGVLLIILLALELKVIKVLFTVGVDTDKFNFIWLLDVFAFGLVNLAGSGVAVTAGNPQIAGLAAAGTMLTLIVGLFILAVKIVFLLTTQIKLRRLPDDSVLPAFFLVVPITCLYGISLFRLTSYFQSFLSVDLSSVLFFTINFSYTIAVAWALFVIYLLSNYLRNQFIKSSYSAPQWSMVWALVGSQVLGVYVQGLYITNVYLATLNYISIILATVVYITIFVKFIQSFFVQVIHVKE